MSVSNGQPADQNTFNNAFVSKTANSTVTGQITLSNGASGSSVSNVQLEINNIKSSVATAESDIDQLQIDVPAVEAKIDNHIVDAIDAHTASAITNIPDGNLAATNVQAALDELQTDIDTRATSTQLSLHVNAFTEAHDAFAISFLAGGTIDSTDVQNAIEEVATDAASDLSTHASTTTSVHGIADTADLLTTSNTKVVTNKDIDGGTASNTNRITLPKATKATLEGLTRKQATIVYASDENKVYADNGTGLVEIGSGAGGGVSGEGGINYIQNSNAEIDTSGWTVSKNTSAGALPDLGFVTSSTNITWTRDTTNFLRDDASFKFTKDAADRQGEQVYYDFDIDPADKARVLEIKFDYQVLSGTYADDDLIVYIYDRTNTAFIEPVAYKIKNAGVAVTHLATFQTAIDSTAYRLVVHVASTSASAYDLLFDSIKVGPQSTNVGAFIGDWTAYTPTITHNTGTMTNYTASGFWRRVGDSIEIQGEVSFTGAGGTFSRLEVSLPSGVTIDSTKLPTLEAVGTAKFLDNGSGVLTGTVDIANNKLFIRQSVVNTNDAGTVTDRVFDADISGTFPFTPVSGDKYSWSTVAIPIVGWGSNVSLSSADSGRTVGLEATRTSTQSLANASQVTIVINNVIKDTFGKLDTATGIYTFAESGFFTLTGQISYASNATGSRGCYLTFSSGTNFNNLIPAAGSGLTTHVQVCGSRYVNTGDTVKLQGYQNSGGALNVTSAVLSVVKFGSPVITAGEFVGCRYTGSTTTIGTTATTLIYPTKNYDSFNAYNTSTGIFKAPMAGYYAIEVGANTGTSASGSIGSAVTLNVVANGTSIRINYFMYQAAQSFNPSFSGATTVYLAAGQELYPTLIRTAGVSSYSLNSDSWLSITKVG